jgi:enolase-phosphatase E1
MDIEGTTTSISFVHDILFPYSKERMSTFIKTHQNDAEILTILDEVKYTVENEKNYLPNNQQIINQLIEWINADRKHPSLKKIQGLIWNEGYTSGEIKGHVYQEVPAALEKWKNKNITLGIYSSGSIKAQKDLFGFSLFGNLNKFISNNFDTNIGHKREIESYQKISQQLSIPSKDILFLSDISEELDAAKSAGFQTIQLVRIGIVPNTGHAQVNSFDDITV